jgi:hypothetical protein
MISKVFLLTAVSAGFSEYRENCYESPHSYCQRVCDETKSCRKDRHSHGSYCKLDQDPPVCFGLYEKKRHHIIDDLRSDERENDSENGLSEYAHHSHHRKKYCFQPNDPHCDDSKLKPVKCGYHHHAHDDGHHNHGDK